MPTEKVVLVVVVEKRLGDDEVMGEEMEQLMADKAAVQSLGMCSADDDGGDEGGEEMAGL